jgi:hypothetical protein
VGRRRYIPLTELYSTEDTSNHETDTREAKSEVKRLPPWRIPELLVVDVPISSARVSPFPRLGTYTLTIKRIHMRLKRKKLAICTAIPARKMLPPV